MQIPESAKNYLIKFLILLFSTSAILVSANRFLPAPFLKDFIHDHFAFIFILQFFWWYLIEFLAVSFVVSEKFENLSLKEILLGSIPGTFAPLNVYFWSLKFFMIVHFSNTLMSQIGFVLGAMVIVQCFIASILEWLVFFGGYKQDAKKSFIAAVLTCFVKIGWLFPLVLIWFLLDKLTR